MLFSKAIEVAGRLAMHHVDGRDLLLRMNVLPALCAQLSDSTPPGLLNVITYVRLFEPLSCVSRSYMLLLMVRMILLHLITVGLWRSCAVTRTPHRNSHRTSWFVNVCLFCLIPLLDCLTFRVWIPIQFFCLHPFAD